MRTFGYYPDDGSSHDHDLDKRIFRLSLFFAAFFTAAFWCVKFTEEIFNLDFTRGGIYPLHLKGLPGIITSPFIHADFNHLISNSIPFFILLLALVYYYRKLSYRIFFLIYLISGICVWLFGRESWHIGASGVVYGLAAFHFVSGVIRNDLRLLIISVIVVFLYGGMVWGIFPINPAISWESHLWGGTAGVILALYYRRYILYRKKFEWEEEPENEEEQPSTSDATIPPAFDHQTTTVVFPKATTGDEKPAQPENKADQEQQ